MEIRVLRYFLAIAREENMTRAAERLHISQPSLSKEIKKLEEELGHELFIRTNKNMILNDEGMLLRKRAEDILVMVDKTAEEFSQLDNIVGGEIRIGCAESYLIKYLARSIKVFKEQYPNFIFHIFSGDTEPVAERLDRGILDLAVIVEPPNLSKYNYLSIPESDKWGLVMRRDSPLAKKEYNRMIVINGLKSINMMPCKGIAAMLSITGTTYVDETTCGYLIGPMLNASGRMEDDGALRSFDVLTACNREGADDFESTVGVLATLNDRRKADVSDAMEIARQEITETVPRGAYPFIIRNDSIGEGIVGIIAGKIAEEYKVPTFVFTSIGNGLLKGSARSFGSVHIKQMMDAASKVIKSYGGHAGAGGLIVHEDDLFALYTMMHRYIGDYKAEISDTIEYDLEIDAADIPAAYTAISRYRPFGEGNPNIVFKVNKFMLCPRKGECFRKMGSNKEGSLNWLWLIRTSSSARSTSFMLKRVIR